MDKNDTKHKCLICGREFGSRNIVLGSLVREQVARYIRNDYPDRNDNNYICIEDLSRYRVNYVHALLQSEMGELTTLENEVLESLHKHEIISSDVDTEFEREWTTGEKLADYIAELEIRHLHEKIDHLLSHQWDRMIQIQEIQLDILSELRYRK